MSKPIALMAAAAIGIGGAAVGTSPASADMLQPLVNENVATSMSVEQVQWGGRRHHFSRGHYPRHFSHRRHRDRDFTAGIIGFGAGALLGSLLTAPRYHHYPQNQAYYHYPQTQAFAYGGYPGSAHVQWCQQRYRSYDVSSDSFLSYDGNRYRCNSPY